MDSNCKKYRNLQLNDDQSLWLGLKLGNPMALNKLFNKYYSDLFFYGLKLISNHDHVADTIQDMFANLWETRKRISEVTHIKAYLFAALRNNLLKPNPRDIFNRINTDNILNKDYSFDISPEEMYIDKESQLESITIIKDLLADLSSKQKEIIYLKFYNNYSNIVIRSILSIKPQSAAILLTRTINLLRKKKKQSNLPIINILTSCLL